MELCESEYENSVGLSINVGLSSIVVIVGEISRLDFVELGSHVEVVSEIVICVDG